MTSRELYDRIGGFRQSGKLVFWHEDAAYVRDVHRLGYRSAVLEGVSVWHAGSPYYSETSPAKAAFHRREDRILARKDAVKRLLLSMPFVAALNARYKWFELPHSYVPPQFDERHTDDGV